MGTGEVERVISSQGRHTVDSDNTQLLTAVWMVAICLVPAGPQHSVTLHQAQHLAGAEQQPSGGQRTPLRCGVLCHPDTVTSLHTSLPPAVSAATSGAGPGSRKWSVCKSYSLIKLLVMLTAPRWMLDSVGLGPAMQHHPG